MITKEQALTANEFHYRECQRIVGPRGGVKLIQEIWRRNGKTQTWKTRPSEWRIPVKYGLFDYGRILDRDSYLWHTAEDCPLDKE